MKYELLSLQLKYFPLNQIYCFLAKPNTEASKSLVNVSRKYKLNDLL